MTYLSIICIYYYECACVCVAIPRHTTFYHEVEHHHDPVIKNHVDGKNGKKCENNNNRVGEHAKT